MMETESSGLLWTGPPSDPHRYQVALGPDGLHAVGSGGEGLVFRASTVISGVTVDVALKMLTTVTLEEYPRLADRAASLQYVHHPNIMRHLEVFVGCPLVADEHPPADEFDLLYSTAEWVPGAPLEEGVREVGPAVGLMWVAQVAEAVEYLHRFRGPGAPDGFVHRDIKPSNVRITPDSRAVLIDFGVARPHTPDDLTEGIGTFLWKAPEIVGGPGTPGKASDAWGVGALAYWAIVGEPPRLEGADVAAGKVEEAASAWGLPNCAALASHVAALLQTHPDRRPSDLSRWASELRAINSGARRHRPAARRTARSASLALLGVAVVLGGIGLGWFVARHDATHARSSGSVSANDATRVARGGQSSISTSTTWPISTSKQGAVKPATHEAGSTGSTTTTTSPPGTGSVVGVGEVTPPATGGVSIPSATPATVATTGGAPSVSPTTTTTAPQATATPPPSTRAETTGGTVHTWTNYSNAGGSAGPVIGAFQTVQIQCRVQGFAVADGNTWWYKIAQNPWNGSYYGSADAFYNNGATSGSLHGTPFVDSSVPVC